MQAGKGEALENRPHDHGESEQDQPLPKPDPEEVAGVVISDDEDIDLTIDVPQAVSTPISEPVLSQKRPLEDRSPHPSPSKKQATEEEERGMPPWEAALPRGVKKEDILPKRYETFTADNGWVCKQLFSSFANSLILVFSSSYAGSHLHLLSEGCALVWGMFVRGCARRDLC